MHLWHISFVIFRLNCVALLSNLLLLLLYQLIKNEKKSFRLLGIEYYLTMKMRGQKKQGEKITISAKTIAKCQVYYYALIV